MKTYHFLAGLPRTGNTLLAAILNQNPQIYCSPISTTTTMLWNHDSLLTQEETLLRLENKEPFLNVGRNIITNYYEDINKPIIIDRDKGWGTPANLSMLKKYITPKPKIIFTIRPILEILTSWINILPEDSFIDFEMKHSNYWYKNYLSKNDNRCDYIMRPWGQMDKTMFSFNEIIKPENEGMFYLVEYNDLINNPQDTMNKIYDYLELPSYVHNFNKIKKLEKDNDEAVGHPASLHEIRPKLNKVSKKPEDVLSEYVINKYSNVGWDKVNYKPNM